MQSLWMLFASALFALTRLHGGSLRTPFLWHHFWRGVLDVVSLWFWFYAISKLPLAAGMTLNYMSPV
jgi:S-adenosylmethionine uptake transporter